MDLMRRAPSGAALLFAGGACFCLVNRVGDANRLHDADLEISRIGITLHSIASLASGQAYFIRGSDP